MKLTFAYREDTKRTYKFDEINANTGAPYQRGDEGFVVGTLYLRKTAFKQRPKTITVEISAEGSTSSAIENFKLVG